MYIDLQTKNHIFLEINTFCKKIFTFSSSASYMTNVNISLKVTFLSPNLTSLEQIDIDKYTCHIPPKFAKHEFIPVLQNLLIGPKANTSPPKINTFQKIEATF